MRDELVNHLDIMKLIMDSGLVDTVSVITFLEKATKALDDGLCLDVIYLDLAKAFDKVPHKVIVCGSDPRQSFVFTRHYNSLFYRVTVVFGLEFYTEWNIVDQRFRFCCLSS